VLPRPGQLQRNYDVVIIGGGGHGLATAYYLAKDYGVRNVAVLERSYLAGGNTARNTAIVRSNYLTPEGVAFYAESVSLFRNLSNELDFNIMYSERGHLTLAHTDAAIRTSRWRAEVNKHLGVDSELIGPEEIFRTICATRSSARSITRRVRSYVMMPSPGDMPPPPRGSAWKSMSIPKSPESSSTATVRSASRRPEAAFMPIESCRPSPDRARV
jgi:hypothetical protein